MLANVMFAQFVIEPEVSIEFDPEATEYRAVSIDCHNNLLYIGTEEETIEVLNAFPPYNLVNTITDADLNGGMGGPFTYEVSATLFHEDRLFIVDVAEGAIFIFDANTLDSITTISHGFSGREFQSPEGAVIHKNLIFLADAGRDTINVYSALPPFDALGAIAVGNRPRYPEVFNNLLYVPLSGDNSISIHNTTPPFDVVETITNAQLGNRLNTPNSIELFNGFLIISNFVGDNVEVFESAPPYNHVTTLNMGLSGAGFNGTGPLKIFNNRLFVVNYFESSNDIEVFRILSPIVPTLSEWGLIILGITLAIFGIVALRNQIKMDRHTVFLGEKGLK